MQYQEKYHDMKNLRYASSKNAHKRLEAVVKADGGYIKKNKLFIIF